MKTYRIYLKCFVDVEANSVEEAEDVVQEMDYNFSHNGDDFRSEILEIEEIKQKKDWHHHQKTLTYCRHEKISH